MLFLCYNLDGDNMKYNFDYDILKSGDEIEFQSYDGEIINCLVGDVNHYDSIEELLTLEGTRYTLSSTNDFKAGVKSINSINGYEEAIRVNGVYAVHITPIEKINYNKSF